MDIKTFIVFFLVVTLIFPLGTTFADDDLEESTHC